MQKNHLLLLKKFKNIESAQLWTLFAVWQVAGSLDEIRRKSVHHGQDVLVGNFSSPIFKFKFKSFYLKFIYFKSFFQLDAR